MRLAQANGRISLERRGEVVEALRALREQVRTLRGRDKEIVALAHKYSQYRNFMYAGRGLGYPVALEGALKLKEISYVHAEGTSGGELKHGPIALLDPEFPVVAVCTESPTRDKMVSNVHEIVARDAPVLALVTRGDHSLDDLANDVLELPPGEEALGAVYARGAPKLHPSRGGAGPGCSVDPPRTLAMGGRGENNGPPPRRGGGAGGGENSSPRRGGRVGWGDKFLPPAR